MPTEPPHQTARTRLSLSAGLVAAGILISRVSGFLRVTIFSYVFGLKSDSADAFNWAIRIPNFLQNLLGEGALSASLIPVYSKLMVTDRALADRVARAVLGIIALITAVVVLIGVTWTPQLVTVIGNGYTGEKRALAIVLVRIMFPGVGLLVVSAWCLAILNSHHRFFLSYAAPVLWNAAMIATLVIFHDEDLSLIATRLAWAAVVGAAAQLAVQVPVVWQLMRGPWRHAGAEVSVHVRQVIVTSLPVVFTRGVVQVSAFIDNAIASFLGTGAVSAFTNATQLYQLPVALFGMAVSSASLPSMSTAVAASLPDAMRTRLTSGQETIAALVVPSMVAFLAFGDVMVALLLERGHFTHADTLYVWSILAGSAVGLLATTVGRLYSAAFYALGDTRTPTQIAILRVVLVGGLGYLLALPLPRLLGVPLIWGAAGLSVSAGMAGWVEFALLRHALSRRLGPVTIPAGIIGRAWLAAAAAAGVATLLRWVVAPHWIVLRGLLILGTYGTLYLVLAQWAGILATTDLLRRALRRRG